MIERFVVDVPEAQLEDLRARLRRTRWPDALAGSGWENGVDLDYLRELVAYWATGYDWRAAERRINRFAHFRAPLGGLTIHFVHERGRGPRPLPLLISHGWPGSFLEFDRLLPLLTDPAAHGADPRDAFDVVAPSLPGYGFSEKPSVPGMSNRRIAELWAELMTALGYARFGAQGGDWGAGISTWLALQHPARLVGLHLNYVPGSYRPDLSEGASLGAAERRFLEEQEAWVGEEGAYGHQQATRPQTLAFGLNDSPAGLAAWIVEKLRAWSDCGGDVESRFPRDELLTHVTLYWLTETIHSSMRLYRESSRTPLALERGQRIEGPTAVAVFPLEAPAPPREWVERGYRVERWTQLPRGGHFAAMEEPELLAQDIRAFFKPLRSAAGAQ